MESYTLNNIITPYTRLLKLIKHSLCVPFPELRRMPQVDVGGQSGRSHTSQECIDSLSTGKRHSRHAGDVSWHGPNVAG